jgi:DNA modification methylase
VAITQQVLIGNCAEILKTLPSESVDCVVTSPPYWGLRDYKTEPVEWSDGWRGQLGLEPTPQLYIQHLVGIFDEVKRVLKKEGTCWVNLGDTYGGTGDKGEFGDPKYADGRNGQSVAVNRMQTAKSLVQIPSRFAIAMTDAGWILRNEIIWYKPNCMPSSAKDRFTVDFEKLFFFVKSKRYYFEQQLEVATEPIGKAKKFGAKTLGGDAVIGSPANRPDRKPYISNGRRNKRTVWSIPTAPYAGPHFAVFPPELVETPIRAGCPPGGVVLDPFGGSGTTGEVARKLGRASIIIELNPEYLELIRERARTDVPDVLGFEEVAP